MSHEGARRVVGRTPGARGPASTSQVPTSAQRGHRATQTMEEPGSFRMRGPFKGPAGNTRKATRMHVHPCCRLRAQLRPRLRTKGRIRDHEPEGRVQGEASLAEQRS